MNPIGCSPKGYNVPESADLQIRHEASGRTPIWQSLARSSASEWSTPGSLRPSVEPHLRQRARARGQAADAGKGCPAVRRDEREPSRSHCTELLRGIDQRGEKALGCGRRRPDRAPSIGKALRCMTAGRRPQGNSRCLSSLPVPGRTRPMLATSDPTGLARCRRHGPPWDGRISFELSARSARETAPP